MATLVKSRAITVECLSHNYKESRYLNFKINERDLEENINFIASKLEKYNVPFYGIYLDEVRDIYDFRISNKDDIEWWIKDLSRSIRIEIENGKYKLDEYKKHHIKNNLIKCQSLIVTNKSSNLTFIVKHDEVEEYVSFIENKIKDKPLSMFLDEFTYINNPQNIASRASISKDIEAFINRINARSR